MKPRISPINIHELQMIRNHKEKELRELRIENITINHKKEENIKKMDCLAGEIYELTCKIQRPEVADDKCDSSQNNPPDQSITTPKPELNSIVKINASEIVGPDSFGGSDFDIPF